MEDASRWVALALGAVGNDLLTSNPASACLVKILARLPVSATKKSVKI